MRCEARRIQSMLLLFVTITTLVVSFGENLLCAGELPGAHGTANSSFQFDLTKTHDGDCPCPPSPSQSTSDHFCAGDCGCPCQAPLPSAALTFTYSRLFTYLYPPEVSRHIPEVYLSLFVPPDSSAV